MHSWSSYITEWNTINDYNKDELLGTVEPQHRKLNFTENMVNDIRGNYSAHIVEVKLLHGSKLSM
jgi:hypothetical protein